MHDITAIGEILIDLTQTGKTDQGVPTFAANPGGAPANVAVAAARLGASTAFIGKLGRDSFGGYLRQVLEENGVDHSGLQESDTPTTMAIVSVDETGERSFSFLRGADCEMVPEGVDEVLAKSSRILHFGSVSLTQGVARSATIFTARAAHRSGILVSYDPNYRPALWRTKQDALEWMSLPLPLVDIIKLAEEELPLLIPGVTDLAEGSRQLAEEHDVALVMITLGAKGVFCRWKGEAFTVPAVPVAHVADTNGAGDTFMGAVLSRLCRRGEHPLEGLERPELEEILAFANRAAALTCSRSGAIPAMPFLAEVEGA